jgi:hypothetical protein
MQQLHAKFKNAYFSRLLQLPESAKVKSERSEESGALSGDSPSGGALPAAIDPDLMAVVNAWPMLPNVQRALEVGPTRSTTDAA